VPNGRDAVRNTVWLLFEQGYSRVIGLFVGLAVARYLGPADFGALAFAMIFVSLFFGAGALGLEAVSVRELVTSPAREAVILGSAWRLQFAGSVLGVAGVLAFAVGFWGIADRTTTMICLSAPMLALPLSGVFIYSLKATVNERPAVIARNACVTIGAAMRLGAIAAGAGVFVFAGVNGLTAVLVLVLSLAVYRRRGGRTSRWQYERPVAVRMLAAGWPLALSAIAVNLSMQVDQVMLRLLADEHAVGIYAAAVRVSEATYVLPAAVSCSTS
jgi:O-antigen/teichoic acid export membrane protein